MTLGVANMKSMLGFEPRTSKPLALSKTRKSEVATFAKEGSEETFVDLNVSSIGSMPTLPERASRKNGLGRTDA